MMVKYLLRSTTTRFFPLVPFFRFLLGSSRAWLGVDVENARRRRRLSPRSKSVLLLYAVAGNNVERELEGHSQCVCCPKKPKIGYPASTLLPACLPREVGRKGSSGSSRTRMRRTKIKYPGIPTFQLRTEDLNPTP
jgi:hypothetical protein